MNHYQFLPLIKKLAISYPHINILVTTGTVSAANIIKNKLPKQVIHQYVCVDLYQSVNRFISHWQPNLSIITESELWPNLITITAKQCPMILLNARISDRSFRRWSIFSSLAKCMLSKFVLCLPQGKLDAERLAHLGATNICYIGNLKFSSPPLPVEAESLSHLHPYLKSKIVLVAASTHKNEEEQIGRLHLQLKTKVPNLLTIIAPRHINRSAEISEQLLNMGCDVKQRSKDEVITADTDIYLADTMGELGIFYSLADIAFIGGSIIAQGGHNPIEAAHFNCAIITGPFTFNFKEIIQEFLKRDAIICCKNKEDMLLKLEYLLLNTEDRINLASNAHKFVTEANDILDKIVDLLKAHFK